MYLVDTDVVSSGATSRLAPSQLVAWMDAQSAMLFVSVVSVADIEGGIAKLQREGATRKSGDPTAWLETVLHLLW
jgi:predicted nucleic acid-binding protein